MRTCQCRKTMGRAGRDGPVRLPALIASSALASSGQGSGRAGATTIICTASGPRVVALDSEDAARHASQQGGALPNAAPPVARCRAGSLRRRCSCTAGWRPSSTLPRRRLPRLPISPAPWRDCRNGRARLLPPDARYPNETDSRPDRGGHVTAYAASICPAAGVLCRRSHSDSCLGTGPDVCSISGRTPSHVWRNAVHSRSRRIPMFRKSLIAALVLAAARNSSGRTPMSEPPRPPRTRSWPRRRPPSR